MSEVEVVACSRCGQEYDATQEVASYIFCPKCAKQDRQNAKKVDEALKFIGEKSGKNTDIR